MCCPAAPRDPKPDLLCEVSWQLGVVVVAAGRRLSVFSIERDELLRSFRMHGHPVDA
jgi:hypothetical protein